jgi:hypothetical protein
MLRVVALIRTDVSEERISSIIRVTIHSISLQPASVASYCYVIPSSPIFVILMTEAILSF